MRIGVIGAGLIGSKLGTLLAPRFAFKGERLGELARRSHLEEILHGLFSVCPFFFRALVPRLPRCRLRARRDPVSQIDA